MKNRYVDSKLSYLDLLFDYFATIPLNDQMKSHIAKYLTVLVSGIYEDIIKSLIKDLTQKETIREDIKKFISLKINYSLRNPDFENIQNFLNQFNNKWMKLLKQQINQQNIDSLNSIIANKNLIAHGDPSYITFENIKEYYLNSKVILIKLDEIILF